MRRFFSFMSGAVLGGLVGSVLALLLTPASGKDMQAQLRGRAQQVQNDVKTAAAARRAELEEQLKALRAPRKMVD